MTNRWNCCKALPKVLFWFCHKLQKKIWYIFTVAKMQFRKHTIIITTSKKTVLDDFKILCWIKWISYWRTFLYSRLDNFSETSSTTKWLTQKGLDVVSVQNTSSAYSSAASSAMGNHNANHLYLTDVIDAKALNSASMLLSLEDFDVSRSSRQVFI